ncbi:uncharacterized protein LOC120173573 [Hibiscus syriacus]|uniref:uncharacterized protein LOC120173573 n=1 Tax=Hibiscus syriacus TaxID=106335 RepID=UPI0019242645|nr:uncharacterized protein LOC120173573 [Hibiscus syriacus]
MKHKAIASLSTLSFIQLESSNTLLLQSHAAPLYSSTMTPVFSCENPYTTGSLRVLDLSIPPQRNHFGDTGSSEETSNIRGDSSCDSSVERLGIVPDLVCWVAGFWDWDFG